MFLSLSFTCCSVVTGKYVFLFLHFWYKLSDSSNLRTDVSMYSTTQKAHTLIPQAHSILPPSLFMKATYGKQNNHSMYSTYCVYARASCCVLSKDSGERIKKERHNVVFTKCCQLFLNIYRVSTTRREGNALRKPWGNMR
jgi:hypothetical protein